jgi:hypothetical protein
MLYARFDVFTAVKIQVAVFWVVKQCSNVVGHQRLTLKMEGARISVMLVSYHITTWCHSPEDQELNATSFAECRNIGNSSTIDVGLCKVESLY